jgi:hypothetical protein
LIRRGQAADLKNEVCATPLDFPRLRSRAALKLQPPTGLSVEGLKVQAHPPKSRGGLTDLEGFLGFQFKVANPSQRDSSLRSE